MVLYMDRKMKRWELALMCGVLCALALGGWLDREQERLADQVIRLHVIANSDSPEDQALKLEVRDQVLAHAEELYPAGADRTAAAAAIQALPEGYDTVCTDGMFSQGEWQLLSIARAAAADPAVLLLDEITANLDAETEARVREALRQASRGRTVLSVSHRIYESFGGRTVEIRPQGQ